jgi:hypothetical protein
MYTIWELTWAHFEWMSHLTCRFAIDRKPHPSDLEHLHWQSVKLVLQRSETTAYRIYKNDAQNALLFWFLLHSLQNKREERKERLMWCLKKSFINHKWMLDENSCWKTWQFQVPKSHIHHNCTSTHSPKWNWCQKWTLT